MPCGAFAFVEGCSRWFCSIPGIPGNVKEVEELLWRGAQSHADESGHRPDGRLGEGVLN